MGVGIDGGAHLALRQEISARDKVKRVVDIWLDHGS